MKRLLILLSLLVATSAFATSINFAGVADTAKALSPKKVVIQHLGSALPDTAYIDSLGAYIMTVDHLLDVKGELEVVALAVTSSATFAPGAHAVFSDGSSANIPRVATDTLDDGPLGGGVKFMAAPVPLTSDGVAVGSALLPFSDLFLASGAVANLANGDTPLTHSSGILTVSGSTAALRMDLSDPNVAHGVTTQVPTTVEGTLAPLSGTVGGLKIAGYIGGANAQALTLYGTGDADNTTKGTTGVGYIDMRAFKKSGTDNGDPGADANLVNISSGNNARFLFDQEGTGHADGVWTDNAFDLAEDYDVWYVPDATGTAERRSTTWSNKDTSWVAEVDTVLITKGAPTKAEEGTVLTVDTTRDNRLTPTTVAYQIVAGIVSYHDAQLGNPMGSIMDKYPQLNLEKPANKQPVALVGIVPTKVTNDNGNVARGDVLVAADREGYAMKLGAIPPAGFTARHIVGIALMPCAKAECISNVQR